MAVLELPPDTAPDPLQVARWRPSAAGSRARVGVIAGLVLLALLIPAIVPGVYTNLVSTALTYALVALSLNILIGYAGQVSLGHAAFFGVGAFTAGYTQTVMALPWLAGLVVAAFTGAMAALVLGGIALRVRGLYLALVTIAYGLFAQEVIFNIRALTGGGAGLPSPRPGFAAGDTAYAYVCLAALALALVFDWRLAGSRAGRAIRALRDDERVASSWGINVTAYKLLAFVLSGVLASVAGGLFSSIRGIVAPADFLFTLSLVFLLATVVGGAGNRWGVIQGGILFAVLPTLLTLMHDNWTFPPFTLISATLEPVISAVLLLLTLTFFPGGIAQQQEHLRRWLGFGRFRHGDDDPLVVAPAVRRVPVDDHAGVRARWDHLLATLGPGQRRPTASRPMLEEPPGLAERWRRLALLRFGGRRDGPTLPRAGRAGRRSRLPGRRPRPEDEPSAAPSHDAVSPPGAPAPEDWERAT